MDVVAVQTRKTTTTSMHPAFAGMTSKKAESSESHWLILSLSKDADDEQKSRIAGSPTEAFGDDEQKQRQWILTAHPEPVEGAGITTRSNVRDDQKQRPNGSRRAPG